MKRSIYRVLFALLCCFPLSFLLLVPSAAAASRADAPPAPDFAKIDAYVNTQIQDAHIPGLALGIIHGNQIAHLHGFGEADATGRVVTPQTPFLLGSTTKSFTAMAVMQLVDAGKIALDAPVQRYLPWFRVADPVASGRITVRHLLNQISGIPTSAGLLPFTEDPSKTYEQYIRELRTVVLTKPVGTTFQYSNANYAILGLIVQEVSGQPYRDYIQERILHALQMQHSFVSLDQAKQAGLAERHQSWFGFPVTTNLPVRESLFSAGYLVSSAEDMTHYLIAQSNGGSYDGRSVLSPQSVDVMHAPASVAYPGFSYAMGWMNLTQNGERVLWHNGDTLDSHAEMFIAPAHQWGIVLLVNEGDSIVNSLSLTTNRIFLGQQILRMLEGQALAPAGWSVNTYYLILDSILAVISILVLVNVLRLPSWYRRLKQRSRLHMVRVSIRVAIELVLPTLVLLGLPAFLGDSWPMLLLGLPDIGWWFLIAMSLVLVTGVLRGVLAVRALREKHVEIHSVPDGLALVGQTE